MSGEELPVVTGLSVFPIKSCQGQSVEAVQLDQYGVVDDRRLMVVDSERRFISQRRFPVLATVTAHYEGSGEKRIMSVCAPSVGEELRFVPVWNGECVECTVWGSHVWAVDQGDTAAVWLSSLIGQSGYYRLMTCTQPSDDRARLVENLPPGLKQRLPPMKMCFADAGPVSLVSHESLADLNRRMSDLYKTEVPLNRFRMNIEVRGCSRAFEEDEWLLVRIGAVPFLVYTSAEVRTLTHWPHLTMGVVCTAPGVL